jgi:GNAT superfamily N-acetyltransferase
MEKIEELRKSLIETNLPMCDPKGCIFHDLKTALLMGFVAYRIDKRRIWMPQLVVYNGFRGQGLGGDLLEHVVKRGNNLGKLFIDTIVHEESNLGWMKCNKFIAEGVERDYFEKRDGIFFRRML